MYEPPLPFNAAAVIVAELPRQIEAAPPALTDKNGFTVTVLMAVFEQPSEVPVTV